MALATEEDCTIEPTFFLIGPELRKDQELKNAVKHFTTSLEFSETGEELVQTADLSEVYVFEHFDDPVCKQLAKNNFRVVGPPVILECAKFNKELPIHQRPLYCLSMQGLVLCFTGFDKREGKISRLVELVHHMGASVRKEVNSRVTHLIARSSGGEKCRRAATFNIQIMTQNWVWSMWEQRYELGVSAIDPCNMDQHKMKTFVGCFFCFIGFKEEDMSNVTQVTRTNGGTVVDIDDQDMTHCIIDDHHVTTCPVDLPVEAYVVKAEWFWESIHLEHCVSEQNHLFKNEADRSRVITPASADRKGRRKRLTVHQLASDNELNNSLGSPSCIDRHGVSGSSFLDATPDTPDLLSTGGTPVACSSVEIPGAVTSPRIKPEVKLSKRLQVVMELLQTERNYVSILDTIINQFRDRLIEQNLLSAQEIKLIFGQIPPIRDLHVKIREELELAINTWSEQTSGVGHVFLNHSQTLITVYPPFINFFEKTKATIKQLSKERSKFLAFLKLSQNLPECRRQSLEELLIRPVQRLPSVILLLNDIAKNTDERNADRGQLQQAVGRLRDVMDLINEDKRKTEGQVAMFDIINDIDNCPPNLLSSHRKFILRVNAVELSNQLYGRSEHIAIFLFSDSLELCKRRARYALAGPSAAKSPSMAVLSSKTPQKALKHIEMLPLNCIKRLLDIQMAGDSREVFAIVCRSNTECKDKMYSFMLEASDGEQVDKQQMLRTLCEHVAQASCRPDPMTLLVSCTPQDVEIDVSELNTSKMAKFQRRVSRAFSLSKTPKAERLKRAVSSIVLSPFQKENRNPSSDDGLSRQSSILRGRWGRSKKQTPARASTLTLNEVETETFATPTDHLPPNPGRRHTCAWEDAISLPATPQRAHSTLPSTPLNNSFKRRLADEQEEPCELNESIFRTPQPAKRIYTIPEDSQN